MIQNLKTGTKQLFSYNLKPPTPVFDNTDVGDEICG